MNRHTRPGVAALLLSLWLGPLHAQESAGLPGTAPLERRDEWSREMLAGISRFADRELDRSVTARAARWQRDLSAPAAYARSVEPNRERLRRLLGATDVRVDSTLEFVATTQRPSLLAANERYEIHAVRWPVFPGVHGEGLLLQPKGGVRARVVVLPDADQTPESVAGLTVGVAPGAQLARRLAEQGAQVLVPVLLSRDDEGSGNPALSRFTNQTHREWIYRQAYQLGRHVIGYEVQKVLAALDWFARENERGPRARLGLAGHAEGGLVALAAAALDPRVDATLVSGYFDSRQRVWTEPIYRNVFGLLREFGDAEIASLVAPRALVIEPRAAPALPGPPAPRPGRAATAAPGALTSPEPEAARRELDRARALVGPALAGGFHFAATPDAALASLWRALGDPAPAPSSAAPAAATGASDAATTAARQLRQVRELERHTQRLLEEAESVRQASFWDKVNPRQAKDWAAATRPWREQFRQENIGHLPVPATPPAVRSRRFAETNSWIGYDVVLEVAPDLIAWGYLLVPKGIAPGERRPVVVCQHGLEGLPEDVINDDRNARAYGYYKAFGARLAERGFVVFAPHNPYRGRDEFRVLQRKLNPLGLTLYAVMVAQQERVLDWLGTQPFVDAARIGYYGLSYGGKTAMRLPALIERYALSICSGDFNEWIRKNASVDLRYSYMFTGEYEMFEYNLGPTFNYAEMAALIAPRPFMVERGHSDGVGADEWVSYEYAKVRRLYTRLGVPERTTIEYFDGPHTINAAGTFDFLHRHLNWPKR